MPRSLRGAFLPEVITLNAVAIAWIFGLITSVSPIGRKQFIKEAQETESEQTARYNQIAQDLLDVVFDPNEAPVYSGDRARMKTASVMLGIMYYESGFRKDVDLGEGSLSKGDGGKSWCMMQINLGKATASGSTPSRIVVDANGKVSVTSDQSLGWSGQDLVADHHKCFRAGLAIMRSSFTSCGQVEDRDHLMMYGSGNCKNGRKESRVRMGLAIRWQGAFTFDDAQVQSWIDGTAPAPEPEQPQSFLGEETPKLSWMLNSTVAL